MDLLEALKRSREEAQRSQDSSNPSAQAIPNVSNPLNDVPGGNTDHERAGWLGGGTVQPVDYPDLFRPPLPQRPSLQPRKSSGTEVHRANSLPQAGSRSSISPSSPGLVIPPRKISRTPSPEKRGGMLKTLRSGGKDGPRTSAAKMPSSLRSRPPAAAKAATQAWGQTARLSLGQPIYSHSQPSKESISTTQNPTNRASFELPPSLDNAGHPISRRTSLNADNSHSPFYFRYTNQIEPPCDSERPKSFYTAPVPTRPTTLDSDASAQQPRRDGPPTPPPHKQHTKPLPTRSKLHKDLPVIDSNALAYRNEYPTPNVKSRKLTTTTASRSRSATSPSGSSILTQETLDVRPLRQAAHRKAISKGSSVQKDRLENSTGSGDEDMSSSIEDDSRSHRERGKERADTIHADLPSTPTSQDSDTPCSESTSEARLWKERVDKVMKNLPKGVDETAAKQIFNEIVIHGDEVHWDDVAGLEVAKSALKETVVYPFLRPDLFMGLREPARGMLLFGPPGTGKTMLARAVATESKSTFFAISASSLTSKFLGESEKLVRALFTLAKALAPSIIFVDEIDSLLSSRSGSGEHEATRRIKTEFLIQWSDLAKAAAGREQSERDRERGDVSRVLVLAATNLPWAIDEAARRRFVRRQYIPLPEDHVRKLQLKTLLSHQKHSLTDEDLDKLVVMTDSFSGSDITALAKDAAMGPLRSLGEKLLRMTMDEIRPIQFEDFKASLTTIRPSVSKQGLKQFEDWAKEFGERGG